MSQPLHGWAGDSAVVSEKPTVVPTSPTATYLSEGETVQGDAVIDVQSGDEQSYQSNDSREEAAAATAETTLWSRLVGQPEPEGVTEINTRVLEETPEGYPRLAAFQASESHFALYRSFNYLHSRVLLDLQDEITCLERELDECDLEDEIRFSQEPDMVSSLNSRTVDVDDYKQYQANLRRRNTMQSEATAVSPTQEHPPPSSNFQRMTRHRRIILAEIKLKLQEYDKWLIRTRTVTSFNHPSDRNYRSVRRYIDNTKPLADSDWDSIRNKEDIISLRAGREWAGFDGFIERTLQHLDQKILHPLLRTERPPLQTFFRTPELQKKTSNKYMHFYSASRIDSLVGILITIIIFSLLVMPVVVLYRLSEEAKKEGREQKSTFDAMGVMVVFTLLFSAAMSMVTRAARHELFAASAAYAAILVVFIGNFAAADK